MADSISKTYDPASIEPEVHRVWMEENCFSADPSAPGEPYCIVIPPPNVTGALHLGHAINNVLQDILIRQHRMRGFNTVWIPGIDHAGIATQAVVEKQLKEKENKTRHDVGREELVRRIWQWKEEFGNRILEQLKRLGCSCDWSRTRFTLDEMCARAVRETFFKLFKDGLIYRGKRLVNWDVHLQTSISDDEIYHETVKTSLWHVRYPIVEDKETRRQGDKEMGGGGATYVVVATTRPETMLGDTAVAVNSQDPRWNWAIGKSVELPLTGRKIPIIADDILVDPKFGTGVVKVTPAHDPNDYAVWQRHQGQADQIDLLNILNPDGTINSNGGKYAGMKREVARKKIVEDLTHAGLLEKEEPYETQIGHSDRSKTPIEPYLSDQWFVKMAPLAEPALQVVRDGIIKFFPERHAQQYLSWLGEKRDWPISRQLWWGHRIPVWRFKGDMPLTEFRKVLDQLKQWEAEGKLALQPSKHDRHDLQGTFISPHRNDEREVINFLEKRGFEQDPDVLDTWFSSALWPHSTLGWPEKTADLAKWYPTSVLLTARDIVTLWVARMVMMGMYNMGRAPFSPSPGTPGEGGGEGRGRGRVNDEIRMTNDESNSDIRHSIIDSSFVIRHSNFPTTPHPNPLPEYGSTELAEVRERGKELGIPFAHVAINPTILDGKGERMSKSKGNGVDPVDVIDTHGADALRFTLTLMATETQDVRMPVKKDAQGRNTSEKFDIGSRFCNKIWQVAQFFVIPNLEKIAPEPVDEKKWSLADRWIISRFNRAVKEADDALAEYRFDQYAKICYDFFYGDFCDWYVEAAKPALKDAKSAGQTANILAAVLDGSLRLMHPMIPFITEIIWWRLCEVRPERGLPGRIMGCTSNRLVLAAWPSGGPFSDGEESEFAKIQQIITTIRGLRNDHKVEPKKAVDVSIVASAEASRQILANRVMIESLANCRLKEVSPTLSPIADAARTVAAGCDLFVQGLVDREAETQRNTKRREELNRLIQTLKGRLANESYIAKAPPHLVKQTQDQLAEAEAELAKL